VEISPVKLLIWDETAAGSEREVHAKRAFESLFTLRLGVPLLFGAGIGGVDGAYNSVFLTRKDGTLCESCRYDKQILFPFGEYIPGAEWLPALERLSPRSSKYSAGPRREPLEFEGRRIAATICYEDIHAPFVRSLSRDAALLVNVSNDDWFSGTAGAEWHFVLAKLRAVEHRKFFVRVGNTGTTAVIDPNGRVQIVLPPDTMTYGRAEVAWLEGQTVYGKIGELPWFCGLAAVLVLRRRAVGVSGALLLGAARGGTARRQSRTRPTPSRRAEPVASCVRGAHPVRNFRKT
jgi:apolipoprotein N-acyltransferase